MQMRQCVNRIAESEHCFDLSGLISAVDVTDINSKQYIAEKEFFAYYLYLYQLPKPAKHSLSNLLACKKAGDKAGSRHCACAMCMQSRKHSEYQR